MRGMLVCVMIYACVCKVDTGRRILGCVSQHPSVPTDQIVLLTKKRANRSADTYYAITSPIKTTKRGPQTAYVVVPKL